MADITVDPASLRAAAARIEQVLGALEAARDRLAGAVLGPPPGPTAGWPGTGGPSGGTPGTSGPGANGPTADWPGTGGPGSGGWGTTGPGGDGSGTGGPGGGRPGTGGPRSGLLRREYRELLADQHQVLTGLATELHADADRLRRAAERYEDTECQNTIEIR